MGGGDASFFFKVVIEAQAIPLGATLINEDYR